MPTTTTTLAPPTTVTPIDHFPGPSIDTPPAEQLAAIRRDAPAFKEWFRSTGTVDLFATRSLVTLPYPRRYALWEACRVPVPYVWMTNRMFVIRWTDADGRTVTMVANPSDYDLGVGTPYLSKTVQRLPMKRDRAIEVFFARHGTVAEHLSKLGIAPEDVDLVTFDHLHTQDIRRLVGTTGPAPDLGFADGPVPPLFPNARFVVQRHELEHVKQVHPFQSRFHQAWTYHDLDESRFLEVDGDVLLGPGMALLRTPGHTFGNNTITVNTADGILCSSENAVAVECWAPERSRIPGVAAYAEEWGFEVILNYNTPEFASWQYNSMVKEKLIADAFPGRPGFPWIVPSSELAKHRLAPGIRPTVANGEVTVGAVR